jgi:hypothetical protein
MSLTSYRAAPPRANVTDRSPQKQKPPLGMPAAAFETLQMGSCSRRQQSLATTYSSIA